jgi:hypothetical protein
MRMLVDIHIIAIANPGRAHVVDERKGPYLPFLAEGQQPADHEVAKVFLAFVYDEFVVGHGLFC